MTEEIGTRWHGYLTVENLHEVTHAIRALLEGKRYTYVAVNEALSQPHIRLHERLSPETSATEPVYSHIGDDRTWGMIGINDTYGAWSCPTSSAGKRTYIAFEPGKLTVDTHAPAGHKVISVFVME